MPRSRVRVYNSRPLYSGLRVPSLQHPLAAPVVRETHAFRVYRGESHSNGPQPPQAVVHNEEGNTWMNRIHQNYAGTAEEITRE